MTYNVFGGTLNPCFIYVSVAAVFYSTRYCICMYMLHFLLHPLMHMHIQFTQCSIFIHLLMYMHIHCVWIKSGLPNKLL